MVESPAPAGRPARHGRAAAWLAKQVELALADSGLTLPQYRVLGLLDAGPDVSSALAERLAVRRPTVSAIVEGLVNRGLVARTSSPEDRRRISLALTPEGRRALDGADRAVDERLVRLARCLDGPGAADAALASLLRWQDAMVAERLAREVAR